ARPFCSDRCRDVDLNRWLTGAYAIPAVEEPDLAEDGEMGEILPLDKDAD
ncbi:MAG: DNA gyrase inhibitor YacG, partial [Alphaproteobacteria bacterium]